jgi:hypothetical protein
MEELKIGQPVRLTSSLKPMTIVGLDLERDVPLAGVTYFNSEGELQYDELPIEALVGVQVA